VVPVRATLLVGWEARVPLFEVRIWGMSLKRRRPPAFLRRLANKLLDAVVRAIPPPSPENPRTDAPTKVRRTGPLLGFAWWTLSALGRFLSQFTRGLDIRLGGVDPALLGGLTGLLGGVAAALGAQRYTWIPDFQPGPFRFRVRWTVSASLAGILIWVGRSASLFPRKRASAGLLPSAP